MTQTPIPETLGYFTPGKAVGDDVLLAGRWDRLPTDLDKLFRASPKLADFAEAALLFHSASPWTPDKKRRWHELVGQANATTKVLCDVARVTLADAGLEE